MTPLRCSSLPRAFHCVGSTLLPGVENSTDEATRGTERHRRLAEGEGERILRGLELGFSFDLVGTEVALDGGNLRGHVDLLGLAGDDVVICDWKGFARTDSTDQLLGYLLLACRKYKRSRGYIVTVHVDDDLSVLWYDCRHIDERDLDEFQERFDALQAARERASENYPQLHSLHSGPWCQRCPAFTSCPAQITLAKAIASDPVIITGALTPSQAAKAWHRLKQVKLICENIESSIRTYATDVPIDLGDGRMLGPVEVGRETINPHRAFEVMPELSELAEMTLTKGAIEKRFGKAAITKLRLAGAAQTKLTTVIKEFASHE